MINMDFVKEIADRYGIGIEVIEEGKGGFIIDETGKVYDNFSKELIDVLKKDDNKVSELCGNCGQEVFIDCDIIGICPFCGKEILPCSICDWDNINCQNECPFRKE